MGWEERNAAILRLEPCQVASRLLHFVPALRVTGLQAADSEHLRREGIFPALFNGGPDVSLLEGIFGDTESEMTPSNR